MVLVLASCLRRCMLTAGPSLCRFGVYRISSSIGDRRDASAILKHAPHKLSAAAIVELAPKRVQPYLKLMRVDKPAGTWLLYWPCTWSIALASPPGMLPSVYMLALFGAGAFFMRAAGCIINDIFDRKYDMKVERTRLRPLCSGELTNGDAVKLLAGLLSASLLILLQLNWLSVMVGASSLLLTVAYPFAKRYTYWPQFVLGATLNWGVLIAWSHLAPNELNTVIPLFIANVLHTVIYDTIYSHQVLLSNQRSLILFFAACRQYSFLAQNFLKYSSRLTFNWGTVLGWTAVQNDLCVGIVASLYASAIVWTLIYDTAYAHQDKADDIVAGVKSTALLFGDSTKYWLTGFATLMVSGLTVTGALVGQTWPYYCMLGATAAQLSWQIGTLKIDEPDDCWTKFRSNQWLGAMLFVGIVAGNLLRKQEREEEEQEQHRHLSAQ
ncbi:unnamed protein product [Toxocara canis]|uniref:4-hydroxybenzoate polyprenyltransferase, mitochondrial n=1 Tax=Toxocara canis TaxID=6265 RepID=A0A183V353_TOXCA|nr:unnamed protein product [Toxocara canis]